MKRNYNFKSTVADVDVTGATPTTVFEEYGLTGEADDFKPNFRELVLAEDKLIADYRKLSTDLEKLKYQKEAMVSQIDFDIKRIEKELSHNLNERLEITRTINQLFNK